jgi:hypothetical protein
MVELQQNETTWLSCPFHAAALILIEPYGEEQIAW